MPLAFDGRCDRSLAAAVLLALDVRPSRSTFVAALAALLLVARFLLIGGDRQRAP